MSLKNDLKEMFEFLEKTPLRTSRMFMDAATYEEVLDFSGQCVNAGHSGYGKPRSECDHPDCIVRHVIEQ